MENKPLLHFTKVKVTAADLDHLDEETASLFLLFGCIHNDISICIRNCQSSHNYRMNNRERAINDLEISRILFDLRQFSSKLFEFRRLISRGSFKHKSLLKAKAELKGIEEHPGFEHAEEIRHNSTNHFDIKEMKKVFRRNTKAQEFTFYLHEFMSNSYFPHNEMFFFSGLFESAEGRELSLEEFNEKLTELYEWTIKSSRWVHKTIAEFILEEVIDTLGKSGEDVAYFVDADCVAEVKSAKPPLVLLKPK